MLSQSDEPDSVAIERMLTREVSMKAKSITKPFDLRTAVSVSQSPENQ